MERTRKVWFPAKTDCKWLWDLPTCWQGWFVVVTWWMTLIAGVIYLSMSIRPWLMTSTFVLAWSALLVVICFLKGERLGILR